MACAYPPCNVTTSQTVLLIAVLIPSVILHEVAHGVVASWFGDQTARQAGRLTLNPIAHVDLFGTILLPTLLALTSPFVFGYAKPVPVRPGNLRRPRDHGLLVSLAGPAVNIVLAVAAALVLRATLQPEAVGLGVDSLAVRIATAVGLINVLLAAFNLIPLPPLDGSAVIERFLPSAALPAWHGLRRWSMLLVLAMVFLTDIPSRVVEVAVRWWAALV